VQQDREMRRVFTRSFIGDRRGNVAAIFAVMLVPIVFMSGMALDFSSAMQKRAKLNAAADAAALAAVTPAMMTQSSAAATTAATNIFTAQASGISGLNYSAPTITVSDAGLYRTVTVSYTATSVNNFPNVLGNQTWSLSGTSQASSYTAPNINFYLLLDNSPSMAVAATTAGINTMLAATANAPSNGQNAGGCAFACHESNPSADNLGNPGGEDNYTLAKNLGVKTRIENMATATQALMSTAASTEAANNATYKMAIYTFNNSGTSTVQTLTSNLTTAATAAGTIDVLEVYEESNGGMLTPTDVNDDTDTNFESAISQINGVMPNPGTGASTSTPQEVLFIVSDGVDDESNSSCSQPLSHGAPIYRCMQPFDTTTCTTIQKRGILIAVLYTVYLPLTTNTFYNQWIAPFQSQIATNMQNCASPGLFFSVTTDGDITAAMQSMFTQAVATARLTK
jgi:Flp pilus assembly protein TadG